MRGQTPALKNQTVMCAQAANMPSTRAAAKFAIAKRLASEQTLACGVVGDSADDDATWPINIDKLSAA